MRKVLLILGPTASGKTARALEVASKIGGEIINCDRMQMYNCLKILTAFPSDSDMQTVPHKLFGVLEYYHESSAVAWAALAAREIETTLDFASKPPESGLLLGDTERRSGVYSGVHEHSSTGSTQQETDSGGLVGSLLHKGKVPIIVGGTGLYVNVLIDGIAPLPTVSKNVREQVANMDYNELCSELYKSDARLIEVIPRQRHHQVIRAYEVFLETGQSVLEFRSLQKKTFLENVQYECEVLSCEREVLYERIDRRFEKMLEMGAVEEVKRLLEVVEYERQQRDAIFKKYPVFNVIGAREIVAYLDGDISLQQMKEAATLNSRHYAKRQITWFRHQLPKGVGIS
ncbi:MAG: tRNA (adenosine(37)-N6)-dimethylallyltransferase MiaA [Holosporales bacterium]|jgi:tRNA dimethylallyltransferase|nr:tRNA (adenosine(37)-N6)-dimethylallyltransferase MiaA [Holosporales bacterium]